MNWILFAYNSAFGNADALKLEMQRCQIDTALAPSAVGDIIFSVDVENLGGVCRNIAYRSSSKTKRITAGIDGGIAVGLVISAVGTDEEKIDVVDLFNKV